MRRHVPDDSFLEELPQKLSGLLHETSISFSSGHYFLKSDRWHGFCLSRRVAQRVLEDLVWLHVPENNALMVGEQWLFRFKNQTLARIVKSQDGFDVVMVDRRNTPRSMFVGGTTDIEFVKRRTEEKLRGYEHEIPLIRKIEKEEKE